MRIDERQSQDSTDRAKQVQELMRRQEAELRTDKPQEKVDSSKDANREQALRDDQQQLQREQDTRHVQGAATAQAEASRAPTDLPASEQVQEKAGIDEARLRDGQDFLKTREERKLPPSIEDQKAAEQRREQERTVQVQDILKQFAIDQQKIKA